MVTLTSDCATCLPAEASSWPFLPVPAGTASRHLDAAVSRRRKQPSRRRKGGDPSGTGRAQPSPRGEPALSLAGAGPSDPEFLVPVSCTFHDPETAVTTYEVRLPAGNGRAPGSLPADLTVVKACKQEHAIEDYPTIRVSRLGFFREDRSSLVWDMQEGVVKTEPRMEERHDDPRDLEEQRRIDAEKAHHHPFDRAATRVSATTVSVKRRQESSFALGDNCLIYCTAIEPSTEDERSQLEDSFKGEGYDHYSPIGQPDMFARALGSMAFQQEGLLGNPITLRHPNNGQTAQCRNLPVVHGPVVYVRDRHEYVRQSSSELEFTVRCIFSKTLSTDPQNMYQDQREYRFAILASRVLDYATVDLAISAEMRQAMRRPGRPLSREASSSLDVGGCDPSPRVLACLSGWTSSPVSARPGRSVLSARLQGNFSFKGVHRENEETIRRVVQTIEDVDYRVIEQSIANEPRRPNDARFVKLTLDGGPGHTVSIYDLGGFNGTYHLTKRSNAMQLNATIARPEDGEIRILIDNAQFGGTFNLDSEATHLILYTTPMNPAATVKIDPPDAAPDLPGHHVRLSETEDTQIAVTATSADGTATSSLSMLIARGLYMDATRIDS